MKILLSEDELRVGIERMASEIKQYAEGRPLTMVGIMVGSVVMMADLIRLLDIPLRVGVVQASSYHGTQRGKLSINSDMMPDISGRDVVLVDDIFDTGHTLIEVIERMSDLNPKSIRSAVLLRKEGRQEVKYTPDFVGFEIPDEFVVGYGLDYEDAYRNLPYLAALEPADLESPVIDSSPA